MSKLFFGRALAAMIVFGTWGFITAEFRIFPYQVYEQAKLGYKEVQRALGLRLPWFFHRTQHTEKVISAIPDAVQPGLTLVSGIGENKAPEARIVDLDGNILHAWDLDWFRVWPDAEHIPPHELPKSRPGTHIHGISLQENGDLVFNYERLGLVRVNFCGDVVWRLPRRTHHSLYQDEQDNFWVPELSFVNEAQSRLPSYLPKYKDPGILKVSPDGRILNEWRIFDIILKHDLTGLLYTTTRANTDTLVTGDTLHVNDVKVFPHDLEEGLFSTGDVMVSIRNINSILVFDRGFTRLKHNFYGPFVRQHDPEFIDGHSITIFDNFTHSSTEDNPRSRLIKMSVATGNAAEVLFEGSESQPFYTNIMGKQQPLANGNYLLAESRHGRAVEVDSSGSIVWEYRNLISEELAALVDDAQRLKPVFDSDFVDRRKSSCQQ